MAADGTIRDANNPTNAEHALAVNAVCKEYLAALMLSGAHLECSNELHTDPKNQYGYGDNHYPKMIDSCLALLNRWTPSSTPQKTPCPPQCQPKDSSNEKNNDKALVFAQPSSTTKLSGASTTNDASSSKPPKTVYKKKPTNFNAVIAANLVTPL